MDKFPSEIIRNHLFSHHFKTSRFC